MFDWLTKELGLIGVVLGLLIGLQVWLVTQLLAIKDVLVDRTRVEAVEKELIAREKTIEAFDDRLDILERPQQLSEESQRFRRAVNRRFSEDRERIARIEDYIFDLAKEARIVWPVKLPPPQQPEESPE